jgi:hypothetical protein
MRIDVFVELHMNCLRVEAVEVGWALVLRRPFTAHDDDAVAEAHLGVRELIIWTQDHHRWLEAEGLLQPAECRLRILVAEGG